VIQAQLRRSTLANYPFGTPFLVLAPEEAGYAGIVRERNDAAVEVRDLGTIADADDVLHPTIPHVLLEGLDDLADPVGFLDRLRSRAPEARIFALVSNAAHLLSLGSFYAGKRLAAGHPLVFEELAPLFIAAGWQPLAITALPDESLKLPQTFPFAVEAGEITFQLFEPVTVERGRNAAFLVVADRR
jgi:hypothetical protein